MLDLLLIIAKRKKLISSVTFAVAVITALFSLSLSNVYTAKTLIVPSEEDKMGMGAMMAQMGGLAGIAGDALGAKTKSDLYVTMLRSENIEDSIIKRFKLMENYKVKYRTKAYKELEKNTKISLGKKDGVITIAVDDTDPKRAADIANTYVSELQRLAIDLRTSQAGNNRAFLGKRISETRADLARAEDLLKDFQARHKAISVSDQAQATIENVARLRAELATQEVQLAALQRQFTNSSQEVKVVQAAISKLKSEIARLEGGGGDSAIPNVGTVPALGQQYIRLMREFKIQETILEILVKQYEMASLSEAKDISPLQVIQEAKVPELKSRPSRAKLVLGLSFLAFVVSGLFVIIRDRLSCLSEDDSAKIKMLLAEFPVLGKYKN